MLFSLWGMIKYLFGILVVYHGGLWAGQQLGLFTAAKGK